MKYFIHLSYKGTHYHGWQRQPKHSSIQAELETQLAKMLGYPVNCIGCGRTDSGVHTSQFVCHIVVKEAFQFDPVFRLNKMLPDDIAIHECIEVPAGIHAQHAATFRTYQYYFHTHKSALLSELSSWYPADDLAIEKLSTLVPEIQGAHNFRTFCKQPELYKNTNCQIMHAAFDQHPNGQQFRFVFRADRFLRGMVRILVAQLLEVAYGRLEEDEFKAALLHQQPFRYFKMAYPQGLYLAEVGYDLVHFRNDFSNLATFSIK